MSLQTMTMTVYVDGKPEQRYYTLVKLRTVLAGYTTYQQEPELRDGELAVYSLSGRVEIVKTH